MERERQELREFAARLIASRRVAQLDVLREESEPDGSPLFTLLFQQIADDGIRGRPVAIQTRGELAYVEALVIKFLPRYVGEGDPLRGRSLALFRRVFGSGESAESVEPLPAQAHRPTAESRPAHTQPPAATSSAADLHDELWAKFWAIADDPEMAARYGVRVAQVEAPAFRPRPGQIWEIRLDAAGGLNLRCVRAGD